MLASTRRDDMVKIPASEFSGCIMFRNYFIPPWLGERISGVTGNCKVVQNSDVLGFETNNRDANWCVVVQGRKVTMVIPGCEILNMQDIAENFPVDLNPDIVEVP